MSTLVNTTLLKDDKHLLGYHLRCGMWFAWRGGLPENWIEKQDESLIEPNGEIVFEDDKIRVIKNVVWNKASSRRDFVGWNDYKRVYEAMSMLIINYYSEQDEVKRLLNDIRSSVIAEVEDSKKMGYDMPHELSIDEDRKTITFCTRYSRNPGLNANGGDYDYYQVYRWYSDGSVVSYPNWSADFDRIQWLGEGEVFHTTFNWEGFKSVVHDVFDSVVHI